MTIKLKTYHTMGFYSNSYNEEVKLEMIQCIVKDGGYAFTYSSEPKKLYQIILKDGEKINTDLGGYRKILKAIRELGVNIDVL